MLNKPRIIAVTGGSGVGKGEACRILAGGGAEIIDADSVSHKMIKRGNPAYSPVLQEFGNGILGEDGEIDRKKLGAIVFADKTRLAALSAIVHPIVREYCEDIVRHTKSDTVVIDAPALIEGNMQGMCDIIIGIFAHRDLRLARIISRDKISREAAEKRINSQMADDVLRGYVDIAINNNGTLQELEENLREI